MQTVISFLKLTRPLNLFFLALTQVFFRYFVVIPILSNFGKYSIFSTGQFFLLVISTVLIAAAGYIINDYFDVKIDIINKPNRVILSNKVHRRWAIVLHVLFNLVALAIAVYLAWYVKNLMLAGIHLAVMGGLWFYSTNYKKQFLVGNIVIAVITALTIVIIGIYEPILFDAYTYSDKLAALSLFRFMFAYSFFAFFVTLIREIVKDMEDIQGDKNYDCKTIPIILGIKASKIIILALSLIVLVATIYIQMHPVVSNATRSWIYVFATIQFPILFMLWNLRKAETKADYAGLSNMIKLIMLLGICSMGYFYYLLVFN